MTDTEKIITTILDDRRGRGNAIKMKDLAKEAGIDDRTLREVINHLKFVHRIPILSWDNPRLGGYYLSKDDLDRKKCLQMFMSRIWTSLKNVATLQGISLIEAGEIFAIELTKKTESEAKDEFMQGLPEPPEGYSLITALARHVQNEPEKYQRDLNLLQNIFGAKFIKRNKLKELADALEKLNSLRSELEV